MESRVPDAYLKQRLDGVQEALSRRDLDGLLVTAPAQKGYLSGFTSGVFIAPGGAVLVTQSGLPNYYLTGGTDFEECKTVLAPLGFEVRAFYGAKGQSVHSLTAGVVAELELKRLGIERKYATLSEFELYRSQLPDTACLLAEGEVVDPLREVKDHWEIEQIKAANLVYQKAFAAALEFARPGISEWELCGHFETCARLHGAGSMRLAGQSVVVSGPRSALPHGSLTRRQLQTGDLVTIDCGTTFNGYCGDVTRTFVLGKASERQREVYQTVLDAQLAAIELMQEGRPRQDCAERGMEIIRERGFEQYMAHGAGGHGIGLEVHEGPSTRGEAPWVGGNVVTIEPGIYIPGWGGVRIEDDVVITNKGPWILTDVDKELLEV